MALKAIGLIGTIGAGKDTVSDYIRDNYKFNVITMGDLVREVAKERGVEANRDNLTAIQKEHVERFGGDYWIKKVVERVKKNRWEKVIINGIRRPVDAEVAKKSFGNDIVLVLVDADVQVRFSRLQRRGRVGDPKTMEEFGHQEQSEFEKFDFKNTLKHVEKTIHNNTSLENLRKSTDDLLKTLRYI